jgi:hypothetical protein
VKRKAPLKRGKPLARSRLRSKQPAGGFPEEVRVKARRRSGGICEAGSLACTGKAAHFHHRKLRRFKDHSLINCLHVCAPCHQFIHDEHPEIARMFAWLLNSWDDPAELLPLKGDRWNEHHRSQR